MKTAKITNFFAKVPPPSKREDTPESDTSQSAALESTSGPVTSESSRSEVILSQFESSRSPTPIQPNVRRIRTSRAIVINSDTSDDEDEKTHGGTEDDQSNAINLTASKHIITSDSEAELKNLTLRSPQKFKRKVIVEEDDDSDTSPHEKSLAIANQYGQVQDTRSNEMNKKADNGLMGTESDSLSLTNRSERDEEDNGLNSVSVSKCTRRSRLKRRNEGSDEEVFHAIDISSDDAQGSEDEVRPTRSKRKVENDSNSEHDSDEDWDVDRNVILGERTRVRKQSRYSQLLTGFKAGKGKAAEYTSEDIPDGPMDRFTSRGTFTLAPVESSVLSKSDLDSDDDDDDFVVADDIIDGQKTTMSQQETSELPAEFSTKYQNNTEGNFRVYFEYLMCRTEDPTYGNRDNIDTRFKVAISAVNRLIETCKDKVYTPVWKAHFTKDLEAWPSMDFRVIHQPDHDCDACMISGKGSSRQVTLYGYRYDDYCFPIQDEERVRSSSTTNLEESDVENAMWLSYRKDRPTKDKYWLGSTCFNRARVYHALVHLQYDACTEIREFILSIQHAFGNDNHASQHSRQNINYFVDRMEDSGLTDKVMFGFKSLRDNTCQNVFLVCIVLDW